jgi:hypothetical protein
MHNAAAESLIHAACRSASYRQAVASVESVFIVAGEQEN